MAKRSEMVGMVFQFPERHFLGSTIENELTFGWPTSFVERQVLSARVYQVLDAIGLNKFSLETKTKHLSDGYKRRLALAVQLVIN